MNPEKLLVIIMLASLMLESGTQVSPARIREVFSNYWLLAREVLVNFILIPLFAVFLVRAFHLSDFIAIGILLMAISPGVPFLARAAGRKVGGSLGFALEMSFVMPALSIITVPITAKLVFPPNTLAAIPFNNLIMTLFVFQLVPLLIGMAIAAWAPRVAEKIARPLAIIGTIAIVAVLALLVPQLVKAIGGIWGQGGIVISLLIVLFSVGAGWLLGGPEPHQRTTLALGSGLRNIGLALVVATTNYPHTLVDSMVLVYFLVQVIVVTISGRVFVRLTKDPGASTAGFPA